VFTVSTNALDPNRMTAAERLAEIGEILAAGLLRLRAREQETTAGRAAKTIDVPCPRKQPRRKRGAA
jgi:hypothetical protein